MRPNVAETYIPNVESRIFQVPQLAISIHMERHFPKLPPQRKRLVNEILPLRLFWTGFITHSDLTTLVTIKTANARRKSPMDTPWRSKPILFPRGFRMLFSKKSRPRCRKNKGDNGIGVSPVFWRVNNGPMHQGVGLSCPKWERIVRNEIVIFDSTSREKRTSG